MAGDILARGAKSATFGPAKISQAKWDAIWADESKEDKNSAAPFRSVARKGIDSAVNSSNKK